MQLAYALGVAQPMAVVVDTFGTGRLKQDELVNIIREVFDLRPKGIIDSLSLKRPIFQCTAAYGHFGRSAGDDGSFSWERTDKVKNLSMLASQYGLEQQ